MQSCEPKRTYRRRNKDILTLFPERRWNFGKKKCTRVSYEVPENTSFWKRRHKKFTTQQAQVAVLIMESLFLSTHLPRNVLKS